VYDEGVKSEDLIYMKCAQLIYWMVPEMFLVVKWAATVEVWGLAPSGF